MGTGRGGPAASAVAGSGGYWAVLAVVGLESLGVPAPGVPALVAAAAYAGATHNLSIGLVLLAAAGGAFLGDNVGYGIGRWAGNWLLVRYGRYVRLTEAEIKVGRYVFLKHGGKVVFFGRFVPLLRRYAAFLAGSARMPWRRFLTYNAAGGVLFALVFGLGAYLLGNEVDRLARPVQLGAVIVAVTVIVTSLAFIRRNMKRLKVEAERALPGRRASL